MAILKFDRSISEFESKGKLIKINQYVKLSDLVGEKFYQTHFYDLSIENPLELCKPSNEDFNFVFYRLWEKEKAAYNLIRAHRIFSNCLLYTSDAADE